MIKSLAKRVLKSSGLFPAARVLYRRLDPTIAALRQREIKFYQAMLAPDSLCFDIGANLGQKSDIFLSAGFRSIAVEPNRFCDDSLKFQFAKNPRVTIVKKAVGRTPGELTLFADDTEATASLKPGWHQKIYGSNHKTPPGYTVPVTTLDELIEEFGIPDYIKIDVEGFEHEVLLGLSRPVPIISFEFHANDMADINQCLSALQKLGPIKVRASDMYGHWLWPQTNDVSDCLKLIESAKAKGDLYVWSR